MYYLYGEVCDAVEKVVPVSGVETESTVVTVRGDRLLVDVKNKYINDLIEDFNAEHLYVEDSDDGQTFVVAVKEQDGKVESIKRRIQIDDVDTLREVLEEIGQGSAGERERAMAAEQALDEKIDAEISRAELAEQTIHDDLQAEINRASLAEQTLTNDLADEVTARTNSIAAEIQARISADNTLRSKIEKEVRDRIDAIEGIGDGIAEETSRAEQAEQALAEALSEENERALQAERNLASNITEERLRALEAEAGLLSKINKEIADRIADVDEEEARAVVAEQLIDEKLDQEIYDRKQALNNLEYTDTPDDTKFVSQVDEEAGIISVTRRSFNPIITEIDGTGSDAPKLNITIADNTSADAVLSKASTSIYGATKLTSTLNTSEETLATTPKYVDNAIKELDATVSQTAGADGLALSITETDGKVTALTGSIAPNTYDSYGDAATVKSELLGDAAASYNTLGKLEDYIIDINSKIPAQASSTNQLADKEYVTDSIITSAGFFRGSFATYATLTAVQWQTTDPTQPYFVSNNDYAYVEADETHNNEAWRYLYVNETGNINNGWTAQFKINDTPFTSAQMAAINSGITSTLVTQIGTNQTNITNHVGDTNNPHSVTKAQVGLGNVDNTSDLNKPISTATQTALDSKQDTLISGTNIKTINNQSLLGSGNITIESGSPSTVLSYGSSTWEDAGLAFYNNRSKDIPILLYYSESSTPVITDLTGPSTVLRCWADDEFGSDIHFEISTSQYRYPNSIRVENLVDHAELFCQDENGNPLAGMRAIVYTPDDAGLYLKSENPMQFTANIAEALVFTTNSTGKVLIPPVNRGGYDYYGIILFNPFPNYVIDRTYNDNGYENVVCRAESNFKIKRLTCHIDNTWTSEDISDNEAKQDVLVSGTNIKTINNQSILGSGNLNTGYEVEYGDRNAWGTILEAINNQQFVYCKAPIKDYTGNEPKDCIAPIHRFYLDDNDEISAVDFCVYEPIYDGNRIDAISIYTIFGDSQGTGGWEWSSKNVAPAPTGPQKYTQTIQITTTTKTFAINHGLGTNDVVVNIYDVATGKDVIADITRSESNGIYTLTIDFDTSTPNGSYRVVVIG